MKVGKVALAPIEPFYTGTHIVEQRFIVLFIAQGMIQELTDKQADSQFGGVR